MRTRTRAILVVALLLAVLAFAWLRRDKTGYNGTLALRVLDATLAPVRDHFARDQGFPKLLIVLPPSAEASIRGADLVSTEVLPKLQAKNLRVYVVWTAASPTDTLDVALKAAAHFPDPRVAQYWDPEGKLADAFGGVLAIPVPAGGAGDRVHGAAWGTYLLFPAGTSWSEGAVPKPSFWMHQHPDLIAAPKLDPEILRAKIDAL